MKASHPYRRGVLLNVYVPNAATTCRHFDEMTERCYVDPLIRGRAMCSSELSLTGIKLYFYLKYIR